MIVKTIQERTAVLLKIFDSEQSILQRNDTKASALLSALGVFMVFFIVHFDKIARHTLARVLVLFYFAAALSAIICLLIAIKPKIAHQGGSKAQATPVRNPTFFGGITAFPDPQEYATYLFEASADDESVYAMFAREVYSIAQINRRKNKWLIRGLLSLIVAITIELFIIMSVYVWVIFGQ